MRKAIPLLTAVFLASICSQGHALTYPPGNGSCPDTLQNSNVNNGPCRPASNCAGFGTGGSVGCDTVLSVKGIITGIKNNGTSRTFYMQSRRTNLAYTGMDVFNGNGLTNSNIQIGDSVSVTGKVEEGFKKTSPSTVAESGETEISGLDASSTTLDVGVNILSSGNSLPAFHTVSIADIRFPACDWNSSSTNASAGTGEPWENCLVRLVGPLIVGRVVYDAATPDPPEYTAPFGDTCITCPSYPGIETRAQSGLHGGGMLCYKEGSPGDSIYIDMTSFVTMTPPPVGTKIDSVVGVLQGGGTRAGFNQIMSWRIAVRSKPTGYSNTATGDLYLATPPEVADAFPVADDSVEVVFDRAVTNASVTVPGHYSLVVSERTVDYAHMVGDNAVVCHIVGAYTVGVPDSVTSFGQTGLVNGLTNNNPDGKTFINGLLDVAAIQSPDPDSLAGGCNDRSKYAGPGITIGPRLSFTGVVTYKLFGREYYIQDQGGGARSGVKVFQPVGVLTVGRKYLLAAGITEFAGETEVEGPTVVRDLGAVSTPPFFTSTLKTMDDFSCDMAQNTTNGEDYEGCLVTLSHTLKVKADAATFVPGGFFHVTDATPPQTDTTDIEINFGGDETRVYVPTEGDYITVRGCLSYRFGQGVLFPRNDGDLVYHGNVGVENVIPGWVTFSARPNPAQVAMLSFGLPRRDKVDLAVFDLAGRRIATIARGTMEPGTYMKQWSGLSDRGGKAGSGIYFYRLKVGPEVYTLRGVRVN